MSKKNIYIHSSGYTNRAFQGHTYFVPYIYLLLRNYFQKHSEFNNEVLWPVIDYVGNNINELANSIEEPFILGLSCYLWSWEKNLQLAKIIKEKYPNCYIVFGGPNVPIGDSLFFEKYPFIDFLVHKEGEKAFTDLLNSLLKKVSLEEIILPSVSHKNHILKEIKKDQALDISKSDDDLNIQNLNKLIIPLKQKNISTAIIFESNRGCPYKCTFCDWGESTGTNIREFNLEIIEKRINEIAKNQFDFVFCSDANFGIKSRDLEIARMWVKAKKKYGFPKSIYFNTAKNTNKRILEIGDIIKNEFEIIPGNTISFQSMNPTVLKNVERKNIGLKNYLDLQKSYNEKGIETYSELIVGLPSESLETWVKGIDQLLNLNILNFHVYPLLICENAPINKNGDIEKYSLEVKKVERSEHSFNIDDTKYYEYANVVISSSTMSRSDYILMNMYSEFALTILNGHFLDFVFNYFNIELSIDRGTIINKIFFNSISSNSNDLIQSAINYLSELCSQNYDFLLRRDIGKRKIKFDEVEIDELFTFQNYFESKFAINAEQFYTEIFSILERDFGHLIDKNKFYEIISFQKALIFKPQDLKINSKINFNYNWLDFYNLNSSLVQSPNQYEFYSNWKSTTSNHVGYFMKLKMNKKFNILAGKTTSNINNVKHVNI